MYTSLIISMGLSLTTMKRLTSDCLMHIYKWYKVTKVKDGNSDINLSKTVKDNIYYYYI